MGRCPRPRNFDDEATVQDKETQGAGSQSDVILEVRIERGDETASELDSTKEKID